MSAREKEIRKWQEERLQLAAAGVSRREAARMGLLATASGALVGVAAEPRQVLAAGTTAAASPWQEAWAWQDPMPVPPPARHVGSDLPNCNHAAHQYYDRFPCRAAYEMTARPIKNCAWNSRMAAAVGADNQSWGYDGVFPGPTLDFKYGHPVLVRHTNQLPDPRTFKGWAYPGSITHLHNFHTASESDGGPWRYTLPGESTDHHYCMRRAAFSDEALAKIPAQFRATDGGGGDERETLTSLFYHQHMPGYTASNVYRGLVGFCRVFDGKDTGDETRGWRLPGLKHDIPLVFADKQYTQGGQVFFDPLSFTGFLGDLQTVNGKIKPYLEVEPRKYRFRLLSAGPSRFYGVALRAFDDLPGTVAGRDVPYVQVTDNGNLLQTPVTWGSSSKSPLEVWVAERSDIVVDFGQLKGKTVYLSNVLPMQPDGKGADRGGGLLNPDDPRNRLLQFRVTKALSAPDASLIQPHYRPYPLPDLGEVVARKRWDLVRQGGGWAIDVDGKGAVPWDPDADHLDALRLNPVNQVKKNTAELWTLTSGGGWEHPLHIHFEEGMVIGRNGATKPVTSRQDIYRLGGSTGKLEVFLRFRDFPDPAFGSTAAAPQPPMPTGDKPKTETTGTKDDNRYDINAGRYVMHCHNVVHEDHAMMATWNIVP